MPPSASALDVTREHQLALAYDLLQSKEDEIEALTHSLALANSLIALLRGEIVETPVLVDTVRRLRAQDTISPASALGKAMADVVARFRGNRPTEA